MLATVLLCAAAVSGGASPLMIRNTTVFDGTGLRRGRDVLVQDGVIAAVGRRVDAPEGTTVMDGSGRTLLPGLIDAHVHVVKPEDLRTALTFGVTTELDMFMPLELAAAIKTEPSTGRGIPGRRRSGVSSTPCTSE
jgi:predicted amidohydrolase YtcJ